MARAPRWQLHFIACQRTTDDTCLSQENLYLLFLTVVVEKTGEWVMSNPRASNSEWGKTRDDS